jgi:hypothetical protein
VTGLASFLEARLAEDERAMPEMLWGETADDNGLDERRARVLREVAAGRKLLEAWSLAEGDTESEGAAGYADGLRRAVEIRACGWSDHPEFGKAWLA